MMPHATWPVPPAVSSARGLGAAVLTAGCGVGGGCSTRCAAAGLTPCRDRASSEFGGADGLGPFSPRRGGHANSATPVASLTGIRSAALAEGDDFLDGGLVVPGRGTDWQTGLSNATPRLGDDARMYWLVVGGCSGWDAYVLSEERMSGAGYGGYSVVTHLRGRRVSIEVPVDCFASSRAIAKYKVSVSRRQRRSMVLSTLGSLHVRAAVTLEGAADYLVSARDPGGALLGSLTVYADFLPNNCGRFGDQVFVDANFSAPRRAGLITLLEPSHAALVGGEAAGAQALYDGIHTSLFPDCLQDLVDWCESCYAVIADPGPTGHGGTEDTPA